MKKKFKDTKVGKFLSEKAPHILNNVADVLPDKGILGIVKNLISNDEKLSAEDKELALKLLEADMNEQQEITKRWQADMMSDSWLSKNIRPLVLMSVVAMMFVFIILDSCNLKFEVNPEWISLYTAVSLTTIGGYFGSRAVEKFHGRKYPK